MFSVLFVANPLNLEASGPVFLSLAARWESLKLYRQRLAELICPPLDGRNVLGRGLVGRRSEWRDEDGNRRLDRHEGTRVIVGVGMRSNTRDRPVSQSRGLGHGVRCRHSLLPI